MQNLLKCYRTFVRQTEISRGQNENLQGRKNKSVYNSILFINWLECPKAKNNDPFSPEAMSLMPNFKFHKTFLLLKFDFCEGLQDVLLSDRLKFSAGQNENLLDLSDSPCINC